MTVDLFKYQFAAIYILSGIFKQKTASIYVIPRGLVQMECVKYTVSGNVVYYTTHPDTISQNKHNKLQKKQHIP